MEQIEKLIERAANFFKNGQLERAEIEFRKILEQFPDHHLAIGALGDYYLQIGQVYLALPLLRRLVTIRPFDYLAHFLLGVAYGKVGRYWHCLEELAKADKMKPNDPEIVRQMGVGLGIKGDIKEGRKYLEKAISLEPESPEAYTDLVANYMFNCEYEKAKEWLKKSLDIDPNNPTTLRLQKDLKENLAKFEKLSPLEKEKRRKEIQSQEYKKQMRIDLMMHYLSEMGESKEDLAEVMLEFKKMGLSGQITMFHDPNTPEGKAAIEYVERHKKIKDLDSQKLTSPEIKQIVNKLLSKQTPIEEKKDLILTLAHQGSIESLKGLKKYAKESDDELKIWVEMAINECKSFLAGEILDEPTIQIHKIGKK